MLGGAEPAGLAVGEATAPRWTKIETDHTVAVAGGVRRQTFHRSHGDVTRLDGSGVFLGYDAGQNILSWRDAAGATAFYGLEFVLGPAPVGARATWAAQLEWRRSDGEGGYRLEAETEAGARFVAELNLSDELTSYCALFAPDRWVLAFYTPSEPGQPPAVPASGIRIQYTGENEVELDRWRIDSFSIQAEEPRIPLRAGANLIDLRSGWDATSTIGRDHERWPAEVRRYVSIRR